MRTMDSKTVLLRMVSCGRASFAVLILLLHGNALADKLSVARQLEQSQAKYATREAWTQRQAELRTGFLKGAGLWPLPDRPPLKVIAHSRRDYGGYSVENVALETIPGFFCTGNLYRSTRLKGPGPAILCPHGHFRPLGRFRVNHQIRCAHLARMGATVFSVSMVGWQDSQQTSHNNPLVLALQTWNNLRAIDYLAAMDNVDPRRIGVTGASGGGTQTFFLAMLDERIKASAPAVIVYPWAAPQGCRCEGGLPVMQEARTNAIELAAAVSPRAQLLISVGKDSTRNFPNFGFPFIKRCYEISGHGGRVENAHFANEGHDFGPSKRRAVYAFFAKHLDMKLLAEDEKKITLEKPSQMLAFNDKHPLPARALKGSTAIAKAFKNLPRSNKQGAGKPRTSAARQSRRDKPRRIPTAKQIAGFRQSYVHPKTGVKLTLKLDARQPPYTTVHKPGKGLNLRKSWQKKYESGVIPYRLNASFVYEETSKKNPAGEKNKYGAYFTPPIDVRIVIKDSGGKVIANFAEPQRILCYH